MLSKDQVQTKIRRKVTMRGSVVLADSTHNKMEEATEMDEGLALWRSR